MTVAPPSRTMMPSFGKALVASTTKRAGCTGVLPRRVLRELGQLLGVLLDPRSRSAEAGRGASFERVDQLRHDAA